MIRKLKRRFVLLATVSEFLLVAVLVALMNVINYSAVIAETDNILDVLSRLSAPFTEGEDADRQGASAPEALPRRGGASEKMQHRDLPEQPEQTAPPSSLPAEEGSPAEAEQEEERSSQPAAWHGRRVDDFLPPGMSPEVPYEARFFTVSVSPEGEITDTDISMIISVDDESVSRYVEKALCGEAEKGFVDSFRYEKTATEEGGTRLVFFDCGRKISAFRRFMLTSVIIGLTGCLLVFVIFIFAAGRIVRPIAESYEKQKRFITDASHEMKTPLTVISANADLLSADYGDNECIEDIRQQASRLSGLTGNLTYLSRMEETGNSLQKIEFPISDLVSEAASGFASVAASGKKELRIDVEEDLTACGAPEEIRRLVCVLMENAMKYSPEGGDVCVTLSAEKKVLTLCVTNSTAEAVHREDLRAVFDRFYRTDASRNSATGGYGIGLSIAKAITEAHGGKIAAATDTGFDFRVVVSLPL